MSETRVEHASMSNSRFLSHLSGRLNPADAANIKQGPRGHEGEHDPPLETPRLFDGSGRVQGLPVPEVVDSAAPSAFLHHA